MSILPADVMETILPFSPLVFLNVNKYYNWRAINFIICNNYSNNDELLVNYTRSNNPTIVDTILKRSNVTEKYLILAMECAIQEDYLSIIKIFLNFNPNLTIEEDCFDGITERLSILSYAAGYGSDNIFQFILESNLLDPAANFNQTLRITLKEQQLNKLKTLINHHQIDLTAPIVEYGSELSRCYPVECALQMAVQGDWEEGITLLLEQPSVIPLARSLDLPLVGDFPNIIQRLLEIKKMPQTLADLEYACREARDPAHVQELLNDSTLQLEPNGGKALYNACLADQQAVIMLLLNDSRINKSAVLQNIENYPQPLKKNFLVAYTEWKLM